MVSVQVQLWKKQGISGCWELLLSNFVITNWKDATVFWPFVKHSKIQPFCVFLAYLVLLAFLLLCFMYNTQKVAKCQISALGNAFFTNIRCWWFFCFALFVFFPRRQWFWPLVIFALRVLILQLKKRKKIPRCYWESQPESFWVSLPCALLCMFHRDLCCKIFSPSYNTETEILMVDTKFVIQTFTYCFSKVFQNLIEASNSIVSILDSKWYFQCLLRG